MRAAAAPRADGANGRNGFVVARAHAAEDEAGVAVGLELDAMVLAGEVQMARNMMADLVRNY